MTELSWAQHSNALTDEIPGAYKDIDLVMADAVDLVEIEQQLAPRLLIAGQGTVLCPAFLGAESQDTEQSPVPTFSC